MVMGMWFETKKEKTPMQEQPKSATYPNGLTPERVAALRLLALNALPSLIAAQPARLKEFQEQHDNDVAGFEFRCERYGDFLAVFAGRGGKRIVSAINLGTCSKIDMHDGSLPDATSSTGVWVMPTTNGIISNAVDHGANPWHGTIAWDRVGPIDQWRVINGPDSRFGYALMKPYPRQTMRSVTNEGPFIPDEFYCDGGFNRVVARHISDITIPGFATCAVDDYVSFEGCDIKILTPAGMGRGVYQTILDAIKDGAPTVMMPSSERA